VGITRFFECLGERKEGLGAHLIPSELQDRHLKELRVLNANAAESQVPPEHLNNEIDFQIEQKHQATGPQRETQFLLLSNIPLFPATLCVCSRLRAALPRIISRDTYLDVVLREFLGAVRLVDDLRHPDHFALVVANWQAQDQIRLVSRLHVDPRIETGILTF
jgi:hypothetical protein